MCARVVILFNLIVALGNKLTVSTYYHCAKWMLSIGYGGLGLGNCSSHPFPVLLFVQTCLSSDNLLTTTPLRVQATQRTQRIIMNDELGMMNIKMRTCYL